MPLIAEERYLCTVSAISRLVVACKCPAPNAKIASLRKPYYFPVSNATYGVAITVLGGLPPTCCAITGISHVQARSVSNGNEGYEAVIKEWKNRRSRKVNPVVLSCGDCSRTTVCCCLSGATPYTHSSPILTQLAHRGFFSQHWKNRVSKDRLARHGITFFLTFTLRVLHIKQPPRDLR